MKIAMLTLSGLAFLGILLLCQTVPAREVYYGIIDGVEARVNDEVITTSQIDEMLQRVEAELGRPFLDEREYERHRQVVLRNLIEDSLLVQEARKRGYEMSQKEKEVEVNREWQRRVAIQGGPMQMERHLTQAGISEEQLKKLIEAEVERSFLRDRLLRTEVTSKARVLPEDVAQYQRGSSPRADDLERISLSHILIAVAPDASPEEDEAARHKAERLATEIRAQGTQAFETYAREHSDHEMTRQSGGSLGAVRRGQLFKEFDVAFDLEPGEITDPVRTSQGYHILKVTEKRTLAEIIQQQKIRTAFEELMNRLQEEAIILTKGRVAE